MGIKTVLDSKNPNIVIYGNHQGTIQSILDFDYLAGKQKPSIVAIVGVQQKILRYFYGNNEITIPGYVSADAINKDIANVVDLFAVALSGRRAVAMCEEAISAFTNVSGGMIFAESVPEKHALSLRKILQGTDKFILGPASVGMAVGGSFKLGAIGGTMPVQIAGSNILSKGSVAIVSTSGGMINEIISLVSRSGHGITFAAAVGGERFPITKPVELIAEAIADPQTKAIVYFGELGGTDEYEIAELLKTSGTNKPFIAYVAGVVAEKFESAPQFGHAKALAQNKSETATAKQQVLRGSGAVVANNFSEFEELIAKLPKEQIMETDKNVTEKLAQMSDRSAPLFRSSISSDKGGEVTILGEPLVKFVGERGLSEIAISMFLGHQPKSNKTVEFYDLCLRLLVDHGPQVSGAVNTMITARAGKDLPSALATGILTIGPRFGGALNEASKNWLSAVASGETPSAFVERFASSKQYIPGIGHKKYSSNNPDPRVLALLNSVEGNGQYITFAKAVADITVNKKAQLILNIDGAIAALLLDIMSEEEGYSHGQLEALIQTEFCNALFIFARSIGFTAHYLEQKRTDESLFRLPDSLMSD